MLHKFTVEVTLSNNGKFCGERYGAHNKIYICPMLYSTRDEIIEFCCLQLDGKGLQLDNKGRYIRPQVCLDKYGPGEKNE